MKILILLKKWPGGVGVVSNSVKKEFEKEGHDVICISREENLKIFSSVKNLFGLRRKYFQIIEKENPDIIYTQDWSMALPLIFPTIRFSKKHFCCFHGNQSGKAKIVQTILGKILGENLIVVGNSLKNRFPKSFLVYNGIDLKKFKLNPKIKKLKNSVGFVNWKLREYNYEKIKLACEKLGKKMLIAENIPYSKMPQFYQKLETFISLPPKYAGFNMSWIEAMACGVPKVIGNDAGIGFKLNIDKIQKGESIENLLKRANKKEYRKEVRAFNWEETSKNLLRIFEK